jgi:DNA-binding LacI/PurR family transcriptional regulator
MDELRRRGAVRIKDLAARFGVSELTVRRDIVELAGKNLLTKVHGGATLPSELARPAPSRRRPPASPRFTIGMVVPSLDYYWPVIVSSARAAASALGVQIQLRGSSYDSAEDRRQITRLIEAKQVQGLLLAPTLEGEGVEEMAEWIGSLPVPVILVEREIRHWTPTPRQVEWVRSDHALGLEMAVHHLHEIGHYRIGLVLSKGSPTSAHLLTGWVRACAELGLPDDLVLRESVSLRTPGHRSTIASLLDRCRDSGTTALIVHSDPEAMSIAQYCTEHQVRIPQDVALVSYDDEVAHLAEPALTAVRPPKAQVGRAAVEMMVARLLAGRRYPAQRLLVVPDLVVRSSSVLPVDGARPDRPAAPEGASRRSRRPATSRGPHARPERD